MPLHDPSKGRYRCIAYDRKGCELGILAQSDDLTAVTPAHVPAREWETHGDKKTHRTIEFQIAGQRIHGYAIEDCGVQLPDEQGGSAWRYCEKLDDGKWHRVDWPPFTKRSPEGNI